MLAQLRALRNRQGEDMGWRPGQLGPSVTTDVNWDNHTTGPALVRSQEGRGQLNWPRVLSA